MNAEMILAGGRIIERPEGWRRIEVQAFCQYVMEAATVLMLLGVVDEVYPSFLLPGEAVWSFNGEPMLPARIGGPSDG